MANFKNFPVIFLMFLTSFLAMASEKVDDAWHDAHVTFYGDMSGRETMQGACGCGDLFEQGYGLETAALSTALFNNGKICGACFEIKCVNSPQWCKPNAGTIKITATNFCPPNYSKPDGNWCNPPLRHFDLSMPMFTKIAEYKAGIVPVQYRRILCSKQGGVKFQIRGNPHWILVLYCIMWEGLEMLVMSRLRVQRMVGCKCQEIGAKIGTYLVGQSLSFHVTTTDAKTLHFYDVAASNWQFGQSYDGKINF